MSGNRTKILRYAFETGVKPSDPEYKRKWRKFKKLYTKGQLI